MTLYDRIVDEAEELARNKVLKFGAEREEIADMISEILDLKPPLGYFTTGAYLAQAAYNRRLRLDEAKEKAIEEAEKMIASVKEVV